MSIEAKDLRIGNWVKRDTQPEGFIIDANSIVTCSLHPAWYEPIPLTPELLEKCMIKVDDKEFKIEISVNWSKTHHTDYWFIVKWYEFIATGESHTGWRPYIQKAKAYPQLKDKPPLEEIFLWGYLETLHQLQNLFHSLTGDELVIDNL